MQIHQYEKELEEMKNMTRQEYVASLRRSVAPIFALLHSCASPPVFVSSPPLPSTRTLRCLLVRLMPSLIDSSHFPPP